MFRCLKKMVVSFVWAKPKAMLGLKKRHVLQICFKYYASIISDH